MLEPKCVLWKRLGAEKIQEQTETLTIKEELAFWQKRTEALRKIQQIMQDKVLGKNTQQPSTVFHKK